MIYTVSKDGALFVWNYGHNEEGKGKWTVTSRHYFGQKAKVNSVAFHRATNLLVVGFSNGYDYIRMGYLYH